MTTWLTSDSHYGHAAVIGYSNRPFKDVNEMDQMMIRSWNDRVRPGDLVYHLGDFSFHKDQAKTVQILRRLTGNKYLIWGNHDKRLRKNQDFLNEWVWCRDLEKIEIQGQKIVLCHYAMLVWDGSHRGNWMLHGHSHGSLKDDPGALRLDVGVDPMGYAPVSFEEIKKIMSKKKFEPVDHHGE